MAEPAEAAAESSDDELPPAAQAEIASAVLESLEAHSAATEIVPAAVVAVAPRAAEDVVAAEAEAEAAEGMPHDVLRPLPALAKDRPPGEGVIGIGQATTHRSVCWFCQGKIAAKSLRLEYALARPGRIPRWIHVGCVARIPSHAREASSYTLHALLQGRTPSDWHAALQQCIASLDR
jgi:hypothetical protein